VDFEIPGQYRELVDSFRAFLDSEVRAVDERFRLELQDDRRDDRMRQAGVELRLRSAELTSSAPWATSSTRPWAS
jgi:hypothetical protein